MSDVIEFAKILRRRISVHPGMLSALDHAIEEFSRGRSHAESGDTVTPAAADNTAALSTTLDELRQIANTRFVHYKDVGLPDECCDGCRHEAGAKSDYINALEAALAAAQADLQRVGKDASQWRSQADELQAEVERLKEYIAKANNSTFGSYGFFTEPDLAAGIEEIKAHQRKNWQRAEAAERERDEQRSMAGALFNEVERLRAMIVPGDAAAHEELLANLEQRAEAAEATLARLREPLTDEECGSLFMAYVQAPHDPGSTMRAVVREFLRLRGVES